MANTNIFLKQMKVTNFFSLMVTEKKPDKWRGTIVFF
jgi:hypothetical protein